VASYTVKTDSYLDSCFNAYAIIIIVYSNHMFSYSYYSTSHLIYIYEMEHFLISIDHVAIDFYCKNFIGSLYSKDTHYNATIYHIECFYLGCDTYSDFDHNSCFLSFDDYSYYPTFHNDYHPS